MLIDQPPRDPPRRVPLLARRRPTGLKPPVDQPAVPRRLSRVPRTTIRTFNAQHAGGFIGAHSWTKRAFRGRHRRLTGPGSLASRCSWAIA